MIEKDWQNLLVLGGVCQFFYAKKPCFTKMIKIYRFNDCFFYNDGGLRLSLTYKGGIIK